MRALPPRGLILLAIGAASCLLSSLVAPRLAPRRRALGLAAFRDPKTVGRRPAVATAAPSANATAAAAARGARAGGSVVAPPAPGAGAAERADPPPPPPLVAGAGDALPPYTVENALRAVRGFRYTLFFFVYDARSDAFHIVHNVPGCDHGCARVYRCAAVVAAALRQRFPARFRGAQEESADFVVLLSTGDAPRIDIRCLQFDHCGSAGYAPLLQFGSVFVDPALLPSAIAMPLPVRPHITCFDEWQQSGGKRGVCQDLRPKPDLQDGRIRSGLVFGELLGLTARPDYWDQLVPQVIWRGTDFQFLHTLFQGLRAPTYASDIEPKLSSFPVDGSPEDGKQWAIDTLWGMGDARLLPRWRGVLLTSEAELEAKKYLDMTGESRLPWANIKFASLMQNGEKVPASQNAEYVRLQELGITAIGEYLSVVDQARFKYHLDLGGGGGTTWTGTVEKLALPGVLLHHVTPTKDWFHDLLVPWEHYIPVETDLSDLRRKYDWAEGHPVEARQIAEQGTEFARWMGSDEGFARLYEEFLVAPLRRVLDAYRPPPSKYRGKSALDIIMDYSNETGAGFAVIGTCGGRHSNSCKKLV